MKIKQAVAATVLFASVSGQQAGADAEMVAASIGAAAAFLIVALKMAWDVNRPWWRAADHTIGPSSLAAQPLMAARNAELLALGYGWGAASLLAVYLFTALRWQHGWQYGCGMALIAGLLVLLARWMRSGAWSAGSVKGLMVATLAHGLAAVGGLAWLIASGKVGSVKGDWAANVVFVAGAVLIAGVSAMGWRTAKVLEGEAGERAANAEL